MIQKTFLLILTLLLTNVYAQSNPLIILDAKKIGMMQDNKEVIEELNAKDISTITVYKDSISKIYGSENGVLVITTKKYILDTFYKNFIEHSPLIENISSSEILATIGIISANPTSKNQPYDEFYKYIDTNTINEKIQEIDKIVFLKPEDAIKINPDWVNGAIEISSIFEEQ